MAGRALRRRSYLMATYRRDTGEQVPDKDKHRFKPENLIEKFPPEYAHIIGVPFTLFKGGKSEPPVPPPNLRHVLALPERQAAYELRFPNVTGYRVEAPDGALEYDYAGVENFEIDCSKFPTQTILASAFCPDEQQMQVQSVFERRDQEICYRLAQALLNRHFADDDRSPKFQYFPQLLEIVRYWYGNKILLLGERDPKFRKLILFEDEKKVSDHLFLGINTQYNTSEYIRPVLNFYNPFGSTKHVSGQTAKDVFDTQKSHVNLVVMDSGWEGIAAKLLESLEVVKAYVKNQFLGLAVPYVKDGKERLYFPDFLVRTQAPDGHESLVLLEITGMNTDKAEKKWYVENRFLPAVNAIRQQHGFPEWRFLEISGDIRDAKPQLEAFFAKKTIG